MIPITDKEFRLLSEFIQSNYGIHLKKEKEALLMGRLQKLLMQNKFTTFTEYYHFLINDKTGEAVATLVNKISTNHTYFMREAEHFDFFRDQVLPYFKNTLRYKDFRIWCAASSSGEEPYTLAMILADYFDNGNPGWDKKLLATDISQEVLDIAKAGIYENERIAPLPMSWRNKYFERIDAVNSRIVERLKGEVVYRRFNLMDEVFPFRKKFHVIFCRNVMIYFDAKTKEILVNKLYDLLEDGGYLFIGHSESLNRETTRFKYVKPAVYRK